MLLLVVVGAVLMLGGLRELSRVLGIRRHGLRTEGTVVDVKETRTPSTLAFYPVVESLLGKLERSGSPRA